MQTQPKAPPKAPPSVDGITKGMKHLGEDVSMTLNDNEQYGVVYSNLSKLSHHEAYGLAKRIAKHERKRKISKRRDQVELHKQMAELKKKMKLARGPDFTEMKPIAREIIYHCQHFKPSGIYFAFTHSYYH